MTDISIVIVSYNTADLTLECIKSVDFACKDIDSEILVIDNASKDDSVKLLKKLKLENTSLVIIKNSENLGFSKAVNIGIKKSTGQYTFLLNPDTKVNKGSIKKLLDFTKEQKNAGLIAPQLVLPDGTVQKSVMHFPTLKNAIKEFWMGEKNAYSLYIPKGKKPIKVDYVVAAALLITPAARQKVGLFDESYFMYFEDFDYCKRVKQSGLDTYYLPLVKVIHHHGASGENIRSKDNQWRRLIPSSKIYHGLVKHHLINFVIWSGQKIRNN